jgi:hypothetical protein
MNNEDDMDFNLKESLHRFFKKENDNSELISNELTTKIEEFLKKEGFILSDIKQVK